MNQKMSEVPSSVGIHYLLGEEGLYSISWLVWNPLLDLKLLIMTWTSCVLMQSFVHCSVQ